MANVLIVDDSTELLDLFSLLLQMKGFEVTTASSEVKLRNQLSLFTPDLILLDVILDDANGRQLCKEIKSENLDHPFPIILISASPELLKDYDECGADDIIEKPFDMDTVVEKIHKVLVAH